MRNKQAIPQIITQKGKVLTRPKVTGYDQVSKNLHQAKNGCWDSNAIKQTYEEVRRWHCVLSEPWPHRKPCSFHFCPLGILLSCEQVQASLMEQCSGGKLKCSAHKAHILQNMLSKAILNHPAIIQLLPYGLSPGKISVRILQLSPSQIIDLQNHESILDYCFK